MDRIWFHERRLQWWRVLRVSLLWGGLLMVLVLATEQREPEPPPAPAAAPLPTAPASAFLARRGFVGLANAPIAAERAARAQAAASAAAVATGEVEVCGVGRVKSAASDRAAQAALEAMRSPAATAAWLDTVIGTGDERARGAALYVRAQLASFEATRHLANADAVCLENAACRKPLDELSSATAERGAARWRDALAQLAATTADPVVYAYAVQACRKQGGARAGPCQQITLERWARLDERDATPWLHLADAARARNDAAGAAEALQRAAQAEQLRWHGLTLVQALLASPPRELSAAQAALLTHDIVGIQSAWISPSYQGPIRHCTDATPTAGVRDTCRQLADLMVRKPGSLLDLTMGITIGERAGWPADRVKQARDSLNALRSSGGAALVPAQALSCPAVERLRRHHVDVGRVGEVAALRQAAAASAPR